jgi:Zn-dependent protease with chaperone function
MFRRAAAGGRRTKGPLGERVHHLLMRANALVTRDFSHAAVDRAMVALNAARAPLPPMIAEVLWMQEPTAFTLFGRYIYISRRLIERCRSDAPVAFALAHEMAHHDLGHVRAAESWVVRALTMAPFRLAAFLLIAFSRWIHSRTHEIEADAYALEICRRAGFDMKKCLECFDILSWYMLDHHDVDGVYGSQVELELDPKLAANPIDRLYIEIRLWFARHRRQHPSVHERRQLLLAQINRVVRQTDANRDHAWVVRQLAVAA